MVSYVALRDRFRADGHAGGGAAAPALARALEDIGWRAVEESSADELASHLVYMVAACVDEHHDPSMLVRDVAGLLRDHGPLLDGGLPPVDAYEPAATELLALYVGGADRPRPDFGVP
jgi:hypothetical protein